MLIEGSFSVKAPLGEVWNFLVDVPRMSVCIPGMLQAAQTDERTFTGTLAFRVGAIKTSFQGSIIKTHENLNSELSGKLTAWDAVTASLINGEVSTHLQALNENSTQVDYRVDLTIRGRLNQFSAPDIQSAIQVMIDEFVSCIRKRFERPSQEKTIPASPLVRALRAIRARTENLLFHSRVNR